MDVDDGHIDKSGVSWQLVAIIVTVMLAGAGLIFKIGGVQSQIDQLVTDDAHTQRFEQQARDSDAKLDARVAVLEAEVKLALSNKK